MYKKDEKVNIVKEEDGNHESLGSYSNLPISFPVLLKVESAVAFYRDDKEGSR